MFMDFFSKYKYTTLFDRATDFVDVYRFCKLPSWIKILGVFLTSRSNMCLNILVRPRRVAWTCRAHCHCSATVTNISDSYYAG